MLTQPVLKLFFNLFISFFLILFSINSFASCIKIIDDKFDFLSQNDSACTNKSTSGILKLYSNPDVSNADGTNNLDTIIAGKNNNGYSIHFTFDRDDSEPLSGEQILFAAYEDMSGGTAVAKAGIRSGEFFYETGSEIINGVNMSAVDDVNIANPHIAIIVYDERRKKIILNIDGAEVTSENIEPISNVSKISRVEFGQNYVGNMGMMYNYAIRLSIQERMEIAGILSSSNKAKITIPTKDSRGVLVSGIDKSEAIKCQPGTALINDNCQNAIVNFSAKPDNTTYAEDTVTFNADHLGESNAVNLICAAGYENGTTIPKYWFTLDGDTPSINVSGDCKARDYSAEFTGIANLVSDLSIVTYNSSYNSGNLAPLPCASGYNSSDDAGYYFHPTTFAIVVVSGTCDLLTVSTFAGNGSASSIDGSTLMNSSFHNPFGILIDSSDNIYIADYSGRKIRKISNSGVISTLATTSFGPFGIDIDNAGNIYFAERHKISKIDSSGNVSLFAGNDQAGYVNGNRLDARFSTTRRLEIKDNDLYVLEEGNNAVRKISLITGEVSVVAGSQESGNVNGNVLDARFRIPDGIAIHPATGDIYISDQGNNQIRKISSGNVSTVAAGLGNLMNMEFDNSGDNLYIADRHQIRKIELSSGDMTIVTGSTSLGYIDGSVESARFKNITDIAFDSSGKIYVVDFSNHRIRMID